MERNTMDGLAPIILEPSRVARWLHLSLGLLACLAILLAGLVMEVKIALLLLWCVFFRWQWQRMVQNPVKGITCRQKQWYVLKAHGEIAIQLTGEQLVLPWLVVLQWRECENGNQQAVALWPDSVNGDDLRRLRVFLRYTDYY